ncbi:unnamed protein product [Cuscuta campestris]|uniref:CCHC-type domain-containing protein n=1 Tax=Cuscuta campestris TaxID=132261 RepID=A0A484MPE7_9ASTE|nr:unnamed protein product [Cuscuta campestris]
MKKVGETTVPKTEDEFDAEDIKKVENYAKAINMLYCAVNPDDYQKISCCTTAKEMWDKLEVTYRLSWCPYGQLLFHSINLRYILESLKLSGENFLDWEKNLRIILDCERKLHILETDPPKTPKANARASELTSFKKYEEDARNVKCIIMASMTAELQRLHADMEVRPMIQRLRDLYQGKPQNSDIYAIKVNMSDFTSWVMDTGCGSHICTSMQNLHEVRHLTEGEVQLKVGNGALVNALAVGTYVLSLPSGLLLHLNNCLFVPAISRNIISVSCLDKAGFSINVKDKCLSVFRNDIYYATAKMTNGLYILDLDATVYNVDVKRSKPNSLNLTYFWHCRLGHINEKRISKLRHSGVLDSFDLESYDMAKGKKKKRRPPPPTPPNKKELRNFLRDMEGESGAGGETLECSDNVDNFPVMTEEDSHPCTKPSEVTVEDDDGSESQTPSLDEERFEQELQKDKPDTNIGDTLVVNPVANAEAPEAAEPTGKENCENETGDNDGKAPGNKVDTPAEKKSFASLFEKNRSEDKGMKLHQVEVEMIEDEEVFIQPEDVTPMEELWGPCLVGCFTGRFPGLAPIQTLVESWKVPCQFLPHHKGWVVFKFLNNEDRDSVLHRDDHRINNKKLLLNIPQDGFMWNAKCFSTMPVWVKLMDVPMQFWGPNSLSKIASKLGRPLFTDGLTNKVASKLTVENDPEDNLAYKKPNFCRVLIHMDLSKPPPSCVKVNFVGGSYSQFVEYEDLPLYCYHCEKFGHTPFDCAQLFEMERKKEQEEQRDREKARVEVLKTTLRTETRDKQEGKQGKDDNDGFTLVGKGKGTLTTHPLKPQYRRETRRDFNAVLDSSERINCHTYAYDMTDLLQFRLNNDLLDAKATGMQFTWNRGSKWAKLDRVLVNCEWDLLQWDCWADFKPMEFQSDHCPVVLNLIHNTNLGPKPFKFFNMWMQHELFDSVVRQIWDTRITGTRQFRLCRKLKLLKHPLKQLNKKEFGHISTRAENARSSYSEMMTRLMTDPQNSALIEQAASLRKKATFYSDAERSFFLQKVKCTFINEGDKCTKFFHALMKKQKVLSSIPFIITSQGSTTTSSETIVEEFIDHYSNIFGNTVPTTPIDWNVFREGPLVPHHEIQNLIKLVDRSEVKEALFSIGNEKSPGPDGYTAAFFKQKWDIVGNSLFEAVSEFFTSGRLLKQINHATVVLIPKLLSRAEAWWIIFFWLNIWGNKDSVTVLANTIQNFSQVSGLFVNPLKSNIFLAGEIKDSKSDLLSLVSFPEGKLPVRYLGLPLTSQIASERDFAPLIAKVDENIRKWNTKSLSSAGRLELIRSVIQGIEGFWFQAFPIHKSVLDRITTLCKAFLWGSKFCKVAWDDICKPKDEGGLGLRNSTIWNQALLAKCFWNIAANKETLWIQWVHSVYLQGSDFWTWNPSKKDSHFFKKIAEIRDSLLQKCGDRFMIEDNLCEMGDIKATKVYDLLRSKGNIRPWMKAIWKPYIPPRYSFTVWLTLRGRLPTKMNLHFLQLDNRNCEFCHTEEETAQHLFFLCENTALIWGAIRNWLNIAPALSTLERAIEWVGRQRHSHCAKRKMWRLAIMCTVYTIWRSRNGCYLDHEGFNTDTIIYKIKVGVYKPSDSSSKSATSHNRLSCSVNRLSGSSEHFQLS